MSTDTIRRAAALVRDTAQAATTGPWGTESAEFGLMVLNRGTGHLVAFAEHVIEAERRGEGL